MSGTTIADLSSVVRSTTEQKKERNKVIQYSLIAVTVFLVFVLVVIGGGGGGGSSGDTKSNTSNALGNTEGTAAELQSNLTASTETTTETTTTAIHLTDTSTTGAAADTPNGVAATNNNNNNLPFASSNQLAEHTGEPTIDDESAEQCVVYDRSSLLIDQYNDNANKKINKLRPIWTPGYPGSGYWIIEKLIPKIVGYDATTVYFHGTCNIPRGKSIQNVGSSLCITHYPFIARNTPVEVETKDKNTAATSNIGIAPPKYMYNKEVIFILRNPAYAIPSYYTRWYGTQQRIRRNHVQPPVDEWIKWRNAKFTTHLNAWKTILTTWHDGIDGTATEKTGIGFYIPYELLIDPNQGPTLIQSLTDYIETNTKFTTIQSAQVDTIKNMTANYECLYNEIVHPNRHPKEYDFTFTEDQRDAFITTLSELITTYKTSDPILSNLLKFYKKDITKNLLVD